jgi:hypothetical protein
MELSTRVRVRRPAVQPRVVAPLALAAFWIATGMPSLYLERPGEASHEAITWMQATLPADAVIIGGDDLWTDLHEPSALGRSFASYHSYWRIAYDGDARRAALPAGWRSIRYVVVTVGLVDSVLRTTHDSAVIEALRNARPIARWTAASSDSGLHPPQVIELWRVADEATTSPGSCADTSSLICARLLANARTNALK